jgi:hypothetical protein
MRGVRNALRNKDNEIHQLERRLKIAEQQAKDYQTKFDASEEARRKLDKQLNDAKREISNLYDAKALLAPPKATDCFAAIKLAMTMSDKFDVWKTSYGRPRRIGTPLRRRASISKMNCTNYNSARFLMLLCHSFCSLQ